MSDDPCLVISSVKLHHQLHCTYLAKSTKVL